LDYLSIALNLDVLFRCASTDSEHYPIGMLASSLYLAKYGERPVKREQFVDGTTRRVASYGEDDLDILDQAIKQKLGDPPIRN
jgi:hypothetical protein